MKTAHFLVEQDAMVQDTRNEEPPDQRFLAEIRWLLSKVGPKLGLRSDQAEELLHRARGDHIVVVNSLMTFLQSTLLEKLNPRPNKKTKPPIVGIYCPTPAYAESMITLAEYVAAWHPCCLLTGDIENHAILNHSLGAYAGRDWIERFDFFDVLIVSTLSLRLPSRAVKVLSFHDIFDSPLGDEREFSHLAEEFGYILSPSKPVTELLRGVFTRSPRNKAIRILPTGYVRLDRNIERIKALGSLVRDRIVYAPTIMADENWNAHCTAYRHAPEILRRLREAFPDDLIVFRPHPGSLRDERIKAAIQAVSGWDRIVIDINASDYLDHYARAKLLVTDMSGTAYTYAFSTERPVVFVSPMEEHVADLGFGRYYWSNRETIGAIAPSVSQVGDVAGAVARRADEYGAAIRRLRDETVYNVGSSLSVILNSLPTIAAGRSRSDWISLASRSTKTARRAPAPKRRESAGAVYRGHRIYRVSNRLVALDEAADRSVLANRETLDAAVRLDRAVIARTLDDLRSLIDRRIERQVQWDDMTAFTTQTTARAAQPAEKRGREYPADSVQITPSDITPSVITEYRGFNIVRIGDRYCACRQILGPIDFSNEENLTALSRERPADFFYAETVDQIRDYIEVKEDSIAQKSTVLKQQTTIHELEEQLRRRDTQMVALEANLETARKTIAGAESATSRARAETEKADTEATRARGEIAILSERLQAAETIAGNLRVDLALGQERLRITEEALARSRERIAGIEYDAAQKAQEVGKLNAALETMRTRVADLDARASQADAEVIEAHERISIYEREASERAGRILALEVARGQMRLEIANLQNRLGEREREVGGHMSVAEALREQLAQSASNLKEREFEMARLSSLAGQSNFRITALEAEISDKNRIISDAAQELGRARNEIAQIKDEAEKSQAARDLALSEADSARLRLEGDLDAAQRQVNALEAAHTEALAAKSRAEQELKAMSFQAADIKLALSQAETGLATAEASRREFLKEAERQAIRAGELQKQLERLNASILLRGIRLLRRKLRI